MLAATSTSLTTAVWYTIRATGVVALVLLTVTTVLGLLSASRVRTRRWPAFAQVDLHKRATLLALVFLGIHVVTAVVDTYVRVGLLSVVVPFVSPFEPFWTGLGTIAVDLLLAVAISSALRQRIAARTWRGLHWLAYGCWPLAMAHALGAGTDAAQLWMDVVAGLCTVAVLAALAWRIGYHRTTQEEQARVGATTTAVPSRHRPPVVGATDPVRAGATGVHHRDRTPGKGSTMTATLDRTERLLRLDPGTRPDPGLDRHVALYGPLVVPTRDDRNWSHAVWRQVADSGLTGRGGGGFPAAAKWDAVTRGGRRPLVVVNAMEGEPASAKDRVLLERSPHLVLDGAEVAAALAGAREVVVCVADDRDPGARAVQRAIDERQASGSRRRFSVVRPPARYVSGEESALVSWLDHRDARPVLRVDKSVPLAMGRRPVLVHNAETMAQVALVARHGSAWFRSVGSPDAPGTTLITISGAVASAGVVEVEMGTPVSELVARVAPTAPVAGILVGGYGGAWLHPSQASTPYAPGPLAAIGATAGVGIVVVLPDTSCGIAETARIARYMAGESAGQCGPCVFGLPAIAEDLELLAAGRADAATLRRIGHRCDTVDGRGACRHPDGVVRLVRSALQVFAADARGPRRGSTVSGHRAPTVLRFPVAPPPQEASA